KGELEGIHFGAGSVLKQDAGTVNTKDIHERIWPAREAYDLVAPVYDNWYWKEFWERNEQPLIDKCISDERPPLAIDVGCGTGTYARVLERISATVGIDPSVRMLAIAKRRALCSTSFIVAQASRLPFKDATVGLAIAARSLCHEKELD